MNKRRIGRMMTIFICMSLVFSLCSIHVFAYWSTYTSYSSKTVTLSGSASNQTATITLPSGASVYSVRSDNGTAVFSQSGSIVSVQVSGATGTTQSAQVWNVKKFSKAEAVTVGPQASQTFSQSYSYNDGTYSGNLYQSGTALLVGGEPSASKTVSYDYTCRYNATATITSIQNGTIYFSWNYPSVSSTYLYSDTDGYSGNIPFTGYSNATYVDSHFDFVSPNYVGETGQGWSTHIFHYAGTVTRPDTREWEMNYSGTVYAGGYDTVTSTVYNCNITVYYSTTSSIWITDTTPPDGNFSLSPSGVTSGNVSIHFTATDSGSGVKSITLPDSTVITGTIVNYTVTENGTYNFSVTDNDGNSKAVPVNISNINRTVSVTHPVSISYSIDPNSNTPFTAPDISLTNNSAIPVNVTVESLSASTGGSIQLNNVSPNKYADWSKLASAQTKSDIALGIGIREATTSGNTWSCIDLASPIFATNISGNTLLGTLSPNGAKGNLSLTAKCGLAWDKSYTAVHNLLLVFEVT